MKTLTTDQEKVLQEIPGYVRKDMIDRWVRYYVRIFREPETPWETGFYDALRTLKDDMNQGVLNNDKDMREC